MNTMLSQGPARTVDGAHAHDDPTCFAAASAVTALPRTPSAVLPTPLPTLAPTDVLSHETAAALHGLPLVSPTAGLMPAASSGPAAEPTGTPAEATGAAAEATGPPAADRAEVRQRLHVSHPRRGGTTPQLLRWHNAVRAADQLSIGGVRVTTPARTVVDLSRDRGVVAGTVAADHLLRRSYSSDATRRELQAVADAQQRRNRFRQVRAVLQIATGTARNPAESVLLVVLRMLGLRDFKQQVRLPLPPGVVREQDSGIGEPGIGSPGAGEPGTGRSGIGESGAEPLTAMAPPFAAEHLLDDLHVEADGATVLASTAEPVSFVFPRLRSIVDVPAAGQAREHIDAHHAQLAALGYEISVCSADELLTPLAGRGDAASFTGRGQIEDRVRQALAGTRLEAEISPAEPGLRPTGAGERP